MLGFFYALCAAFFAAASDVCSKRALQGASPLVIGWVRFAYATPFLLLTGLGLEGPWPDSAFWMILVCLLPLEISAVLLYMKAIQVSPLSLTVPFLSLTPVFTLLTSWILLGEFPDRLGLAGVILIAVGAYLLNVHLSREGVLEPVRAVFLERGSGMMVGVAFLYSITSNLGKMAIQHASPLFMVTFYFPFLAVASLPLFLRAGMRLSDLRAGGWVLWGIGLSQAMMAICHFYAISMILVPYMISVKRLSLLLGVVFGGLFFHEEHIRERLFGSALMVGGVCLIVL